MNPVSSACYVVDSEYNVLIVNDAARELYPRLVPGEKCYACLMELDQPCRLCPVAAGVTGPRTYVDPIRNILETVDAVQLPIPGHGICHALVLGTVGKDEELSGTLPTTARELRNMAVIKALAADYQDVMLVDLESGDLSVYRRDGKATQIDHIRSMPGTYEERIRQLTQRYIPEEDRGRILRDFTLAAMRDQLSRSESTVDHFRAYADGELHYYTRKAVRIGDPESFTQAVIGICCEDNEVLHRRKSRRLEMDSLTGLYTREAFFLRSAELMEANKDKELDFCLLKLSNLARINRQYGRAAGDGILCQISAELKRSMPAVYCLSHMGDGVFACILEGLPNQERKQRIRDTHARIMAQSGVRNAVLKWALYPMIPKGISVEDAYERTAYALSTIRSSADQDIVEFDNSVIERMEWEEFVAREFDSALQNGEFITHYQPKYSARTRRIIGAEALVRWVRPDGTVIPPFRFIPILENIGRIARLDTYVFRLACAFSKKLRTMGLPVVPISVNLSRASMFVTDTGKEYSEISAEYGISPDSVPIEITESAEVNGNTIRTFAEDLIRSGFVLHMDDFGAGYSSLASLQQIPYQCIKLDKSLIDYIGTENGESLLKHTIAFARESNKVVIAEGVETQEQFLFLKVTGCDIIQGYYFSKPVDEQTFVEMLRDCGEW